MAAYVPVQDLKRPTVGQLDPELQALGLEGKLTRVEGWAEARALSHALSGLGLAFNDLKVPDHVIARPLTAEEVRHTHNGISFIYNEVSRTLIPETPVGFQWSKMKAIISVSDQGATNRAALHFLAYGPQETRLMLGLQWDPFHRCWNGLKAAMRKASLWKMVLSLSISYNLPYGPFNSGQWFHRKAQAAKEFFESNGHHSSTFASYIPYICWELNIPEPTFPEDVEELWHKVQDSEHWRKKGPLVKLMRWLSFFQSSNFYTGDHMALKMVLTHGGLHGMTHDEDEEDTALPTRQTQDDKTARAELQELKKSKGTWKVAGKVLHARHTMQKDILCVVSRAACTHHSEEARELLTAEQVFQHTLKSVTNQGWAQELVTGLFFHPFFYLQFLVSVRCAFVEGWL